MAILMTILFWEWTNIEYTVRKLATVIVLLNYKAPTDEHLIIA